MWSEIENEMENSWFVLKIERNQTESLSMRKFEKNVPFREGQNSSYSLKNPWFALRNRMKRAYCLLMGDKGKLMREFRFGKAKKLQNR